MGSGEYTVPYDYMQFAAEVGWRWVPAGGEPAGWNAGGSLNTASDDLTDEHRLRPALPKGRPGPFPGTTRLAGCRTTRPCRFVPPFTALFFCLGMATGQTGCDANQIRRPYTEGCIPPTRKTRSPGTTRGLPACARPSPRRPAALACFSGCSLSWRQHYRSALL